MREGAWAMTEMVTVSVTVPVQSVSDLYQYAGDLVASSGGDAANGSGAGGKRWGFGKSAVRKAYNGGQSDYWRPFLEAMAAEAGEWVSWPDLCEAIGLSPKEASGMIGAAERRCKGRPPYEKVWEGGVRYFRMPVDVADVIKDLASKGGE